MRDVINSEPLKATNETLLYVLGKMFNVDIINATYQNKRLHGGTIGEVFLVSGIAETVHNKSLPYKVVLKIQKKFERYADSNSWRREYDLYSSRFNEVFSDGFSWPKCYHTELNDDEIQIWMEYAEGVSGNDMTVEMYEHAAEAIGRFQGKIYTEKPDVLEDISNLSEVDYIKKNYLHYRSWPEVYDFIRSENCDIPRHLCDMLIELDENSEKVWNGIEKLPVVFCHRDYWITNIFYEDSKVVAIDWDTAGWGYLGEDIASLIADESELDKMLVCYRKCIPAYYKGFSTYYKECPITEHCIYELILVMFGYRLIEWYKFAESSDEKELQLNILQKIYEMGQETKRI